MLGDSGRRGNDADPKAGASWLRQSGVLEALLRGSGWVCRAQRAPSTSSTAQLVDLDGKVRFESKGGLAAALEGAIKQGVRLERLDLRGADLRGARIEPANDRSWVYLESSDFSGADLRGAHIGRANLVGADLSDARMTNCDLHTVNAMGAVLRRTDLSGSSLTMVGMGGVDGEEVDFSGCRLDTVGFSSAHLLRARFSRSRLENFDRSGGFNHADLSYADLSSVVADGQVPFIRTVLRGADLSGSNLRGAVFLDSTLDLCVMVSADLQGARLERVSCIGVDAVGADLRSAEIDAVNFDIAKLERVDLRGARVLRISMDQAVLDDMLFDAEEAPRFETPSCIAKRLGG